MTAIGKLIYLSTWTRPDITYAVSVLAQYNSKHNEEHWKLVKHLLRYLSGTVNLALEVGGRLDSDQHPLCVFSDASYEVLRRIQEVVWL